MLTLVIQIRYGYGGFCVVAVATSHLPLPPMKRARSTHGGPSGTPGKSGKSGRSGPSGRRARISCVFCGATDRPSNHTCAEKQKSLACPTVVTLGAAPWTQRWWIWRLVPGSGRAVTAVAVEERTTAVAAVAPVAVAVPCACAGSGTLRLRSVMGPADSDNEQQDWTTEEEGSDSADGEAAEGPVEQDRQQRRRTTWRYPSLGRQGNRAPCTAPPLATPSPLRWR
jgi:hypothetical protein